MTKKLYEVLILRLPCRLVIKNFFIGTPLYTKILFVFISIFHVNNANPTNLDPETNFISPARPLQSNAADSGREIIRQDPSVEVFFIVCETDNKHTSSKTEPCDYRKETCAIQQKHKKHKEK